jgi:hypothetical protein
VSPEFRIVVQEQDVRSARGAQSHVAVWSEASTRSAKPLDTWVRRFNEVAAAVVGAVVTYHDLLDTFGGCANAVKCTAQIARPVSGTDADSYSELHQAPH